MPIEDTTPIAPPTTATPGYDKVETRVIFASLPQHSSKETYELGWAMAVGIANSSGHMREDCNVRSSVQSRREITVKFSAYIPLNEGTIKLTCEHLSAQELEGGITQANTVLGSGVVPPDASTMAVSTVISAPTPDSTEWYDETPVIIGVSLGILTFVGSILIIPMVQCEKDAYNEVLDGIRGGFIVGLKCGEKTARKTLSDTTKSHTFEVPYGISCIQLWAEKNHGRISLQAFQAQIAIGECIVL